MVKFPLNNPGKIKMKKYDLRLENIESIQKIISGNSPAKRRKSFGGEVVLENKEIIDAFRNLLSNGFSVILGNIQGNIQKGQNIFEENNQLINQKVISE